MTDTSPQEHPFASPGIIEGDSLHQLVGHQVYQVLYYVQWVYVAMFLQVISLIPIFVIALVNVWNSEKSATPSWINFALFGWLALLYLFSVYGVLRLMVATKSNALTLLVNLLLALCPCISVFAMLSVVDQASERLELEGFPFCRTGPDWKTIRAMAASQALENESPSNETIS